jgi:dolichol-phosphate mannosyltransferase
MEGVLASASPYVAVIDADLQHDERLLAQMLKLLKGGTVDLVVGSRYLSGGGIGNWNLRRAWLSEIGTRLARLACKADITDPLSGFFICRREVFERALRRMSGQGFKVLLDLLASSPQPVRVSELPYSFRQRQHGESKLDTADCLGVRHAAGRQNDRPHCSSAVCSFWDDWGCRAGPPPRHPLDRVDPFPV